MPPTSNTLQTVLKDVTRVTSNYRCTLIDIGLVIEKLMGGAFESRYASRKFKQRYVEYQHELEREAVSTGRWHCSFLRGQAEAPR